LPNYMEAAFAPAEARYRQAVLADTWGHLAPKKNKKYKGYVIFALGCFDSGYINPTPLSFELDDLNSSPWFYSAIHEWLQDMVEPMGLEEGNIYRFDGYFKNYEFVGTVSKMKLVHDTTLIQKG